MKATWKYNILALIFTSFLAACGTFEIGIEDNTILETQENTVVETVDQPTTEVTEEVFPTATHTPIPSDEQLIMAALEKWFAKPADQLEITVAAVDGDYATGGISNGYFLAARQGEIWAIVYAGQANPPCSDIDQYQFPIEMVPECLDAGNTLVNRAANTDNPVENPQSLDCGLGSPGADPGTAGYIACNIQDGLRSRNTSALLGYMSDPFIIGYWLSEGVMYTPSDFLEVLHGLYNYDDLDYARNLSFTTDRRQFPEMDGRPVEERFGPDVNVVEVIYSQGWGPEGDQEAMFFIVQDPAGDFKWHSMISGDLDVAIP
jgi:hypothetical protein